MRLITGIEQCAFSSVILFILFFDVINVRRVKCISSEILLLLHDLHCLPHVDDSLIISTDRDVIELRGILFLEKKEKKM